MDDNSHVFLIKDKIRCIQKKIMDQLAADLNNALNDTHMLTSSVSNIPTTSSSSITTITKSKRRRKRQNNNESTQQKTEASGSTTPENTTNRTNKQSIVSDSDDMAVTSKTRSSSLVAASESDSASRTDEIRRHRRPFKKPSIPSSLKTDQLMKLTRCSSIKTTDSTTMNTYVRRRRRNCQSESGSRLIDVDKNSITPSSSACSSTINHTNFAGKRKRSRAIVHDDFRLRNNSVHDYDMTNIDETNLTNFSSSSSLNLSDSDKDPCLTSNEADDEQSDWPRDESSVPRIISWWEDNDQDKSDDDDDDDDSDEKMLTTTDGTLQKIVNGALHMMLGNSKNTIQNRIQSFVNREMLTGNRRNLASKNAYTHPHPKRHVRLLKDTRRSHHSSYSHKRVKSDHYPSKQNDSITSIDQNGPPSSVQNNRSYENTPMDTSERIDNEQNLSLANQISHT